MERSLPAVKLVDNTGLRYFWNRIKTLLGGKSDLGHGHSAADVSQMLNYSKPQEASAIASSDTLNQAVGKLERRVDTAEQYGKDAIPIGTIVYLAASSVPPGYLVCNGAAVSRGLYPKLFEVIGTLYGAGDGSGTFNVPNLIDRFIEGSSSFVGTSVEAGLPNISGGHLRLLDAGNRETVSGGPWTVSVFTDDINPYASTTDRRGYDCDIDFDASLANPIYGNSTTVQPPAVKMLPCIKAYIPESFSISESTDFTRLIQDSISELRQELQALNAIVNAIGTITYFSGTAIPSKHLMCDGLAYSRTEYSDLFAVIGTRYGEGDGFTTFNIPNLIDRFPQGSGTPGTVKSAGLPNISGTLADIPTASASGCFSRSASNTADNRASNDSISGGSRFGTVALNANSSNSIYGASGTVQPPALTLVPIIRALP